MFCPVLPDSSGRTLAFYDATLLEHSCMTLLPWDCFPPHAHVLCQITHIYSLCHDIITAWTQSQQHSTILCTSVQLTRELIL